LQLQRPSQSGGKIAGGVVLVADDLIALVDGLEQGKSVADTEDGCEASGEQLAGWRTGVLRDLISELVDELLLAFFDVRLEITKNGVNNRPLSNRVGFQDTFRDG
jgi:hypothetical protein